MEPPADPAEPSDPADPSDPSDRAEARAKPQGKWALVRSLNHALKTYAVLPVRPARGGGDCTLGIPPRASVSPPGRNGMSGNGWQSTRVCADSPPPPPRRLMPSLTPRVNLAPVAPPCIGSFCTSQMGM